VQQIGSKAFANCSSLQTIAYNAVSCNIEQSWLEGCSAFEELNIGNGVQVIPRYSFFNCVGLNSVVLPETITTIGDFAFKGCSGLTAINIPNTVTSIGNKAFFDCQGLTSVILPASLNTMGTFAFGNCSRLTSVYYQAEQLESGSLPFDGCPSLATVYIDPCVRVIGSEVFRNCQTVHFIVALGDAPAVLEVNAFADIANNSVLMVPCGKQVTYFSSWNMFPYNSIIEDCSTYGINVGTIGNGGSVSSSVAEARMGQEVQLTITPDPGMNLSTLKVCNASDPTQIIPIAFMGKADSFYKFTMPSFEVVVLAAFASNTAVEDNLEKLFPVIVYPNPTKDVIKIKAENIHQITISNMLGQIIYVGRVDGSEVDYNFSGEESGIYLVSVETNRGVSVKKVLVSR
jgi:hypothetical protein